MNFAFPTLLIFLLVIPGIIARYCYRKGFWTAPVDFSTVSEEIAIGGIWAIAIHFLWIPLFQNLLNIPIDFKASFLFLTGQIGLQPEILQKSLDVIQVHPENVLLYFLGIDFFALILGYLGHFLVRYLCLDLQFSIIRFKNDWYYILRGEALAFSNSSSSKALSRAEIRELLNSVNGAYISVVADQGNEAYLCRGILNDFFFDRQGQLDRLVLIEAQRRLLVKDSEFTQTDRALDDEVESINQDRYYPIRGNFFVINYSSVKTLNVEYFGLELAEETEP